MYWLLPLLLLLSGCSSNGNIALTTESVSENNVSSLSRISVGMSEAQVLKIMRHPYKQESFNRIEGEYDIWFYVTRATALGQSRLVQQNLTPLVFRNGVLVGWGYSYYNYALKQDDPKKVPSPKDHDDPGKNIEKALETPAAPRTAPPKTGQPQKSPPPKNVKPQQTPPAAPSDSDPEQYPQKILPMDDGSKPPPKNQPKARVPNDGGGQNKETPQGPQQ